MLSVVYIRGEPLAGTLSEAEAICHKVLLRTAVECTEVRIPSPLSPSGLTPGLPQPGTYPRLHTM